MSIDWAAELLDPIYEELGVEAQIAPASGSDPVTVTALDLSAGVTIGSAIEVPTLEPAAALRVAELAGHGLIAAELIDGTITLNGTAWKIRAPAPKPSPAGEAAGEVLLLLEAINASA